MDVNCLHIHLYVIATNNLCNNAFVEYIDNWTQSYSLITIYRGRQKQYLTDES